ncbi:Hypothetical protein D9617_4g000860 [Elsinoe fawcettii]|nr:Hypothetical protein D9617_4g000860 [Elsinoe fawcettii]
MPNPCNDLGQLGSFLGLIKAKQVEAEDTPTLSKDNDGNSVFVCVDLEAFEFDHKNILEVGVSTLDSRHLTAEVVAKPASEWFKQIRSEHYIIEEGRHLVNKRFVKGCPDGFIFGKSKVLPAVQARAVLRQHLSAPRSIFSDDLASPVYDSSPDVYIVAHGLKNDTTLMKNFGIDNVYDLGLAGDVDTQKICSGKKKPAGLKRLLDAVEIPYENLHNGGNDCAYTLQSLVKMIYLEHHDPKDLARRLEVLRHPPEQPKKKKQRRGPKGEGERSVADVVVPYGQTRAPLANGHHHVTQAAASEEKLKDSTIDAGVKEV